MRRSIDMTTSNKHIFVYNLKIFTRKARSHLSFRRDPLTASASESSRENTRYTHTRHRWAGVSLIKVGNVSLAMLSLSVATGDAQSLLLSGNRSEAAFHLFQVCVWSRLVRRVAREKSSWISTLKLLFWCRRQRKKKTPSEFYECWTKCFTDS